MSAPAGQLLERMVSSTVHVRLKDERELTGRLVGCDEHLNLVLEDVHERAGERQRRLGTIVLRGSNVVSLSASGPGRAART